MEIKDKAKSLGSTVRKNIEKEVIIIKILKIIVIENENPFSSIKRVFNMMIIRIKKESPLRLVNHLFTNFPAIINGINERKIINNGVIIGFSPG